MYKDKKYKDVISAVNAKLPELNNAKIKPKYELLKAYAIGKIMSKDDYKAALDYISINYANTEEGKKAKEILTQLKKD
jgi:protein involved in gliding motility SprE